QEAVAQIRQALAAYQATGTQLICPHFLGLLADALHKARRTDEGLCILDEALAVAHRNGERYYEAELYRLKGELLLDQSTGQAISQAAAASRRSVAAPAHGARIADCFNQAIQIAKRQKARSLELRGIMSLARLYRNQGKAHEARSRLTEIYNSF